MKKSIILIIAIFLLVSAIVSAQNIPTLEWKTSFSGQIPFGTELDFEAYAYSDFAPLSVEVYVLDDDLNTVSTLRKLSLMPGDPLDDYKPDYKIDYLEQMTLKPEHYVREGDYELVITTYNSIDGYRTEDLTFSVEGTHPTLTQNIPDICFDEDTTYSINLSNYFVDADGDDIAYLAGKESIENLSVSIAGSIVILTPDANWYGERVIFFYASDDDFDTLTSSNLVTITVNPVNDKPQVSNIPGESISAGEAFSTINLDEYVEDVDNLDSEIIWSVSGSDKLTFVIDNDRVATITYPEEFEGSETITFIASDGELSDSDDAVFSVDIPNNIPVAYPYTVTTLENTDVEITLVCTDDDEDDVFTYYVIEPDHGSLSDVEGDKVTYSPGMPYSDSASFDYYCNDGEDDSELATISITITFVLDPIANFTVVPSKGTKNTIFQFDARNSYDPNEQEEPSESCGNADVNLDGKVDIFDLLALLKILKDSSLPGGDVDENGKVDIFDVLALLKLIGSDDVCSESLPTTLEYRWDFGEGFTEYSSSRTTTYQYSTSGTKTVTLEVRNSGMKTDTYEKDIFVNDAPIIIGQVPLSTPEETPLEIKLEHLIVTDHGNTYPDDFTLTVLPGSNYNLTGTTITPVDNFNGDLTVPVFVNDGIENSNTFDITISVTGVNDLPSITSIDLTPKPRASSDEYLTCNVTVEDIDGDEVKAEFYWVINGEFVGMNGRGCVEGVCSLGMRPSVTSPGDEVYCYVLPKDDESIGERQDSNTVKINTPPTIDVDLTPNSPTTDDGLTCTGTTSDVDSDTVTVTYVFKKGSTQVSSGSADCSGNTCNATLQNSETGPGDTITCIMEPYDSYDYGDEDSESVTIQITNRPPYEPNNPDPSDGATDVGRYPSLSWSGGDPDGDSVRYDVYFGTSESPSSVSENQFSLHYDADNLDCGQTYYWKIVARDEHGSETSGNLWHFTTEELVVVNNPPTIQVDITPNNPVSSNDLTCTGTTNDVNNDVVTATYAFTGDYIDAGDAVCNGNICTATVSNVDTVEGDTITCTMVPYDGEDYGTAQSDSVTIQEEIVNNPPSVPFDENPLDGSTNVSVDVTLSWNATDEDGDSLLFNVFLGTDEDLTIFDRVQQNYDYTYEPDTLEYGQTYYWKLIIWDGTDSTEGPVWNFTTEEEVMDVNNPPVAYNVSVETLEETLVEITLDCTDSDGDTLSYPLGSAPLHGTYTQDGDKISYTPSLDYNGEDSFTYACYDGEDYSNSAEVVITVNTVNDAPIANDVSVTTDENTAVTVTLDCSDVDSGAFTYNIVSNPSSGSLGAISLDQVTYTPNADYFGSDSFTYNCNDGSVDSNTATVSVTVSEANEAPVLDGIPDQNIDEDSEFNDNLVDLYQYHNDIDGSDDASSYSIVSQTESDIVNCAMDSDRYIDCTTQENRFGSSTIVVRATDADGDYDEDTFVVNVANVNDAPSAQDLSVSTDENIPVTITLQCNDIDDITWSYNIVSNPSNGNLGSVNVNQVTYTPNTNYDGSDSFTYRCYDGKDYGDPATVSITVNDVNFPPQWTTNILDVALDEDFGTITHVVDISTYVSDPEGTAVTFDVQVEDLSQVDCELSGNQLILNSVQDWNGVAICTIRATDADGQIADDTFTITINSILDDPYFTTSPILTATEGVAYSYDSDAVDPDGTALTFSLTTNPSGMSINSASGVVSWTPTFAQIGNHDIIIQVQDGSGVTVTQSYTITVSQNSGINHAPVLSSIGDKAVRETDLLQFIVSGTDADLDALTYSASNIPNGATLDNLTGAFSWTPSDTQAGSYNVTFTVSDGTLADSETINIAVSDYVAPVIVDRSPSRKSMLRISSVKVPNYVGYYRGGDMLPVEITFVNDGSKKVNNAPVQVGLFDSYLDLLSYPRRVNINVEKGQSITKRVYLELPYNLERGDEYFVRVSSSSAYTGGTVYKRVTF